MLTRVVRRYFPYWCLFLWYATAVAMAQNRPEWVCRPWQSDEGLPNNSVSGLAQTADGFIWLATSVGLVRFDGTTFEGVPSDTFVESPHRGVVLLQKNTAGGLFVVTDRGAIFELRPGQLADRLNPTELPKLVPSVLTTDKENRVWVGYPNGDGYRFDKGAAVKLSILAGASQLKGSITSLATDVAGRVWMAKGTGIGVFGNDGFHALIDFKAPRDILLAAAADGGMWICRGLELLHCSPIGGLKLCGEIHPDSKVKVTALLEASNGYVWIGTGFGGLFCYNGSKFEKVPTSHSDILALMEDRDSNLWVGTGGGGINRIRPRSVWMEGADSGLPVQTVHSLCQDTDGVVWATTANGALVQKIGDQWTADVNDAVGRGTSKLSVAADSSGGIWIGARGTTLLHWFHGELKSWRQTEGFNISHPYALLAARNGDLWIGSGVYGRVQRLRAGTFRSFSLPPETRMIRGITEDTEGRIWIGTSNGFLLRAEGDQLVDETARTVDVPKSIRCLYATPDGSVWIGYAGSGLGRIKKNEYSRISTSQGLAEDFISQILFDASGYLWFGGDHGIFKVRQQDLNAVAEGRAQSVYSSYCGRDEGLLTLQADFGFAPGAMKRADGCLLFPMRSALAVIDPLRIGASSSAFLPPLVTQFTEDGKIRARYGSVIPVKNAIDLRGGETLFRLPPTHGQLEFSFTALKFNDPTSLRFQYLLEGFDAHWTEGQERKVRYARLPAGSYRFRVQSANNDGLWTESASTIALVVDPFFWQTWWFRIITFVVATGVLATVVRYLSVRRVRAALVVIERQAALDKERGRIARDIHDDLGANLTEITLLSELAQSPKAPAEEIREDIRRIGVKARHLTHALDEIVWAVNPRNDTIDGFVTYTCIYAQEFLKTAGIRCRLQVPKELTDRPLATNIRHNLFLVTKEALNNVVKYACATEVTVTIMIQPKSFDLIIKDNGFGFDPQSVSGNCVTGTDRGTVPGRAGGNGLPNMERRMEEIGGGFALESAPGRGTMITLSIRL